MVTFKLVEKNGANLVYWYYPEGREESHPGVIVADLNTDDIDIRELAAEDWERDIPPEEINELIEAINQMEREQGTSNFIELATEPEHTVYYGDHAVSEICKYLRSGEIPEKGMQFWY